MVRVRAFLVPNKYVYVYVKNMAEYIQKKVREIVDKDPTPLLNGCRPKIVIIPEFYGADYSYYQSSIEVIRWIVETERADICVEVSMMSSHLVLPRKRHLK